MRAREQETGTTRHFRDRDVGKLEITRKTNAFRRDAKLWCLNAAIVVESYSVTQ